MAAPVLNADSPSKRGTLEINSPPSSPLVKTPLEANSPALSPRKSDESDPQKRRRTGVPPLSLTPIDWWTREVLEDEALAETYAPLRVALDELRKYFDEYWRNAKDEWWCRKSGKVVLSVVVCRRCVDNELIAFRGRNTEVCLPAGSLCAEIAAISRAAADFYSSSSIVAVATMDPDDKANPLWPCNHCESYFTKLRTQSSETIVMAVSSSSFQKFAVRVNGVYQSMPRLPKAHSADVIPDVVLCDGTREMPWEAEDLVYIDGAWTFMHSAQLSILREARSRGSHLLVGVHSDEVLKHHLDLPVLQSFETRFERILQDRYVSSVLKDAPWSLTADMLKNLGVKKVICASSDKSHCGGRSVLDSDPYKVARELGILEVVSSNEDASQCGVMR